MTGPSPRARGSPVPVVPPTVRAGSIPASAGKPVPADRQPRTVRVHPRERGEAAGGRAAPASGSGPSPRARGSLTNTPALEMPARSIPASAGKPETADSCASRPGVHPRERGEAAVRGGSSGHRPGPSPRARGSRRIPRCGRVIRRSIPASAGKPSAPATSVHIAQVHPRERGEAWPVAALRPVAAGPSPRARGSRLRHRPVRMRQGSIPASAGKPSVIRCTVFSQSVHPRERGEAGQRLDFGQRALGPSPRARGSRRSSRRSSRRLGSIPASAGKPWCFRRLLDAERVHPRERGEAMMVATLSALSRGPSPRARGSHPPPGRRARRARSIPASAGKPRGGRPRRRSRQVHPRERGEAGRRGPRRPSPQGPSPRARGSLYLRGALRTVDGSIPASAGKPEDESFSRLLHSVHPRERGEAIPSEAFDDIASGPSPRARGSPLGAPLRRRR